MTNSNHVSGARPSADAFGWGKPLIWGKRMIPLSVSDVLKLLDEIPIWKAVARLPKRVAELERKVQQLETAASAKPSLPVGRECPICGAAMKVAAELAHPQFGFSGTKVHKMECPECGHKTERDFQPGKGYE